MSDFKNTNMVVQSNSLIQQTNWKLNQVPLKILKVCISCIDVKKPNTTVRLKKSELVQFIDSKESENYSYLRKRCDDLITAVKAVDDDKKDITVALVRKVSWEKDTDYVEFTFSDELMPFLTFLSGNFLQYQVNNLKCFNSKYGLIIYEYLLSLKKREHEKNVFYISVSSLRNLTATNKKYDKWVNFEEYVLKAALKDINENQLEILFNYEKVKEGRNIIGINFFVKMRRSHNDRYIEQNLL